MYQTTVPEALDPQSKREAAPGADKVAGSFPEEDGNRAASNTRDATCKNEQAAQSCARGVDGLQNAELEDKHETDERQRVETDEEERCPGST